MSRPVRCQKRDDLGNVFTSTGLAASQRYLSFRPDDGYGCIILLPEVCVGTNVGFDFARADGIDPDVVTGELQ